MFPSKFKHSLLTQVVTFPRLLYKIALFCLYSSRAQKLRYESGADFLGVRTPKVF